MTLNCNPIPHVQSMIWATDSLGMQILLRPSKKLESDTQVYLAKHLATTLGKDPLRKHVAPFTKAGINSCPHTHQEAVALEVYATPLIKTAGYDVDAIMLAYHSKSDMCAPEAQKRDVLHKGGYWGINLHPFDSIFAKTNRKIQPEVVARLSEWVDGESYTSYDYC